MKKKLFTLLFALVAIATTAQAQVVLNAENFPDANFRKALASILKISEGDEITAEKIAATTLLRVSVRKIADLTGIENFTALEELYCNGNQLTSLDVSKNTALKYLSCSNSQLTSLDVSQNTALTELLCYGNQLTALDVSKNSALTNLSCYNNQLASLDVSKNTALTTLSCSNNQLTALDVSKNTALTKLGCGANQLTSLDVTGATALTYMECDNNQLTELDVSKNTALTVFICYSNQLNSLDVSKNTSLTFLGCADNQLTSLDVSQNTSLTELSCGSNQLTSLDVSKNTALKGLSCYSNQLTALDVSKNTALTKLGCDNNQLTSLDVSQNTALTELQCFSNQIKGEAMDALVASLPASYVAVRGNFYVIDTKDEKEGNVCTKTQVTFSKRKGWKVYDYDGGGTYYQQYGYPEYEGSGQEIEGVLLNAENFPDANFRAALAKELSINEGDYILEVEIAATETLKISWKSIADITGIEHFTALTYLDCSGNQLTTLDVSGCTALRNLICYNNQLTSLDVSKNTALTYLSCGSNQLTSIDLSKNTALTELSCYRNQLTSIDVSKNTALTELDCSGNQLTSIDMSYNTMLTELYCGGNKLTSLDVSKNTALTTLRCGDNQLTSLDVSKNTALTTLYCYCNHIKEKAMSELVASLPDVSKGEFGVICTQDENERNVCTKAQVKVAKEKGWRISDYSKEPPSFEGMDDPDPEYEGSDPVEEDIDPVDEDDNIDFGSDMDENDDLNGNVIGDIFYNIGNGNGEYNTEEGCIVLKKTTDDETVDGLSGKDIFGEDFKGQFTGIVFKVPSGKGTVKVTAETTGNMLLKVKIGDGEPVEMELNGKLKISFPYNVSETTLVAIYAGANNEAKGLGTTNATDDATLKIYGIEFERGETTGVGASLNDNGKMINDSWYTIDGVKLNGEPMKKGIYIYNGKKVKK